MLNMTEQIVQTIGKKIVHGELKAGDTLPKIEDISEHFGVSRTVVREALKILAARKMVKSNQKSGTIVLPRANWNIWDLEVMEWLCEIDLHDEPFLIYLTEIREALEPLAASLAAQRATEEDLKKIESTYKKLILTLDDPVAWSEADYEFHLSICEASHNDLLISMLKLLGKATVISRKKTYGAIRDSEKENEPSLEVLLRHEALYLAIKEGNANLAYQKSLDMMVRVKQLLQKLSD
ncbi:FadR/GntR family transcriptional regulator [Rummeliibacillus sp. JY-2-4R]